MYQTTCIIIKSSENGLIKYFDEYCHNAKLLKNAVIFRCRQLLFAKQKGFKNLTDTEQQVLDEFKQTEDKYKPISEKYYLPSYYHFDYMFKKTKNPDYYSSLPAHPTQLVIKECLKDFKSFFKKMKNYSKNPSKYTGRPNLPKYIKNDKISFDISNQQALIKESNGNVFLQLPKTKLTVKLGKLKLTNLKEVTIKPFYNTYKICIVCKIEDPMQNILDSNRILGIDLGINNFVTTSNNVGLNPFVINGKELKSFNQYYNKKSSKLKSLLRTGQYTSKRLENLYKYRNNYFTDKMHKISTYIIDYCINNNIGTIVVGKNKQWKTNVNLGKINNQNFTQIPHSIFIKKLKEKAVIQGITVIEIEEAYTSKASFLDGDIVPNYNSNNLTHQFSGKRIKRGLYKSKNGILINADVNGASNIIKKEYPNAFDNCPNLEYLYKTTIKITL